MSEDVWPYLSTEPYLLRHAMAAYLLRDCAQVVEIGGHKVSMADFVFDRPVTVVGPECESKSFPNAKYVRKTFQEWDCWPGKFGDFGFVMLGFELFGLSDKDWARMARFIDRSHRTVVEIAKGLEHAEQNFDMLLSLSSKQVTVKWEMNIRQEPEAYWHARQMHLLE